MGITTPRTLAFYVYQLELHNLITKGIFYLAVQMPHIVARIISFVRLFKFAVKFKDGREAFFLTLLQYIWHFAFFKTTAMELTQIKPYGVRILFLKDYHRNLRSLIGIKVGFSNIWVNT